MATFYQFAITNAKNHLRSDSNKAKVNNTCPSGESGMTAFTVSEVLSIVFCKAKEEIMQDLVNDYPQE